MKPYVFRGGTAVVTGAASGIGEALAHDLASRGSGLVLLDRDAERLAGVAAAIRSRRAVPVDTLVADLADRAATLAAADRLAEEHPEATLLVNNAGVALGGRFEQLTLEEFDWLLDINFRAPVALTHRLLPVLRSHPGSHLVNVSSVFGIIAPPSQSAYVASKFALRGFTEALRAELAGRVGVTAVHPGGIRTRIAETARMAEGMSRAEVAAGHALFERLLRIPPSVAAEAILDGVERRRGRVLIGASASIPDAVARLAPVGYTRLLRLDRR